MDLEEIHQLVSRHTLLSAWFRPDTGDVILSYKPSLDSVQPGSNYARFTKHEVEKSEYVKKLAVGIPFTMTCRVGLPTKHLQLPDLCQDTLIHTLLGDVLEFAVIILRKQLSLYKLLIIFCSSPYVSVPFCTKKSILTHHICNLFGHACFASFSSLS